MLPFDRHRRGSVPLLLLVAATVVACNDVTGPDRQLRDEAAQDSLAAATAAERATIAAIISDARERLLPSLVDRDGAASIEHALDLLTGTLRGKNHVTRMSAVAALRRALDASGGGVDGADDATLAAIGLVVDRATPLALEPPAAP